MLFIVNAYTRAVIRDSASKATRDALSSYNFDKNASKASQTCLTSFEEDIDSALPTSTTSDISATCEIQGNKVILEINGTLTNISGVFLPFDLNESTIRNLERK